MPDRFELFAACLPGLEPLLAGELTALGIAPRAQRGGVAFTGDRETAMRAGLWLGTASHVLLRLATFPCRALGELQRKATDLPWPRWLRSDVAVAVRATARTSRVYHTGAIAERIENALAAALGGPPPAPAGDAPAAHVHVRFRDDVCTISVDASATPLHRRGYRLATGKAPLREDLAHALLLAAGAPAAGAVLDPFCGSGTIAIEAAGRALGLAPGRLRAPPLAHLALFDDTAWRRARGFAPDCGPESPRIAAGDRDAGAVANARANAERAGVAAAIEFTCGAFTAHPWLAAPGTAPPRGVLATNLPFGVRLRTRNLLPLYQTLGHRARALGAAWNVALLAHDVALARRTGLPLRAAWTTRHGGLAVTAMTGPCLHAAPDARPAPDA